MKAILGTFRLNTGSQAINNRPISALGCHLRISFALVVAGALGASADVAAQICTDAWRAELISVEGAVEFRLQRGRDWMPAARGNTFCLGDSVRVQAYGRAAVLVPGQTEIRLDQNSGITFTPSQDEHESWLELLIGVVHIISRDPRAIRIITPYANAGIEGTEFLVEVVEGQTRITVFEGEVSVSNDAGQASATSGSRVTAAAGRLPTLEQAVVRAPDAVQWTLYYTPILDGELPLPEASPAAGEASDPRFYTRRAASRLGVGRVDEAQADLARALELQPSNADALALQAMIAVTQNDRDRAAELADRATAADPQSTSALIARSYVRQAFFDVNGALEDLNQAVEVAPTNAHAWARLSELSLAVGDVERAQSAADEAVRLNPNVARTHTVRGFAFLSQGDTEQAIQAFETAIELDQAAPLTRLGLGLAEIQEGRLEAGRRAIEEAVIHDPGNALIRSYMGKAYYEEHDTRAGSQLDMAKGLDPNDPTPFFYDAIRKQTTNRPVEAARDLQESIRLNDNRAAYRSRLLLDGDLTVRSAALGRVYTDLGFERLAVLEGSKSVNTDPSNHSGHRFLADTYAALPRHEIARVNELYQSQLLQPLNVTPIQPQLGESNLFILDSAGPTDISFSEFNPAFNRNRLAFQASGVRGGNTTWGEDLTVAGIAERVSYSVGQFHFETDGFRENNDLEQDVLNAFVQYRPSAKTTVLAEFRTTEREQGDLSLLFHGQNYLADLRASEDTNSLKLGIRRQLSVQSQLLGSVVYEQADVTTTMLPFFSYAAELDGYTGELQHIYSAERWRQVTGLRYTTRETDEVIVASIPVPFPPFVIESTTVQSVPNDNVSAYSYSEIELSDRLAFSIGASADYLDDGRVDRDRVNPKIGITWEPRSETTFRVAAFRTIQAPTFSRQDIQPRLEPTQVSGFNQFYYGSDSEQVVQSAFGVDQEVSANLYVGAEWLAREIEIPFIMQEDPPGTGFLTSVEDVDERLRRAYVYWMPTAKTSLAVEYQYDDVASKNPDFVPLGFAELTTHRLPVQFGYFTESGVSLKLVGTWVDQDGIFRDQNPPFLNFADQDRFWVMDASLGYRLPKRRGIVSLSIKNAFDEEFQFQDIDPENPRIVPERFVSLRFTLAI